MYEAKMERDIPNPRAANPRNDGDTALSEEGTSLLLQIMSILMEDLFPLIPFTRLIHPLPLPPLTVETIEEPDGIDPGLAVQFWNGTIITAIGVEGREVSVARARVRPREKADMTTDTTMDTGATTNTTLVSRQIVYFAS